MNNTNAKSLYKDKSVFTALIPSLLKSIHTLVHKYPDASLIKQLNLTLRRVSYFIT